jgi:hypothetical protein
MTVEEGNKFFYRGTSLHRQHEVQTRTLARHPEHQARRRVQQELLDSRLYMNQSGRDISSLYMDDGYLSFYPDPVEVAGGRRQHRPDRCASVKGKQYRIRNVIIKGNTKTNDHVIRREIRTKPGAALQPQRRDPHAATSSWHLGYFDPEKTTVNPIQDPRTGTVDLEYVVEEKPSDRLELSGGWGAGPGGPVLGLSFTNFSHAQHLQERSVDTAARGRWTDAEPARTDQRPLLPELQHELRGALARWSQTELPQLLGAFHSARPTGETKYMNGSDGRIRNPNLQQLISPEPPSVWASAYLAG